MNYFKQNLKEIVTELLDDNEELRDNDNRLLAKVWNHQVRNLGKEPKEITGYDFLRLMAEGRIANNESVTRCRRKLQEHKPELRGERYWDRQEKAQNQVKGELKQWDWLV